MRVLFVTFLYPPDIGGTAAIAERTVTALSDAGHSVTVLTTNRNASSLAQQVTFLKCRRLPLIYVLSMCLHCWKHDKQQNFDHILINDLPSAKSAALTFTRSMLRRTILIVHGSEPENVFLKPTLLTRATFFSYFYGRLLSQCHSIVAFSSFMKSKFLRGAQATSLEDKLRVCKHVLTAEQLGGKGPRSQEPEPPTSTQRYIVLTVSRIVEQKGFERMLRIMSSVISTDRSVHWNIVGSGPYESTLRRRIRELSLEENIHFAGKISDQSLLTQFYRKSNLFLLLSEYEEGLGLVYLEAAAQGIPSIANDKSGEREAVEPGISGFLTKSDEEVADIILQRRAEPLRNSAPIYEFASSFDVKHLPKCMFRRE